MGGQVIAPWSTHRGAGTFWLCLLSFRPPPSANSASVFLWEPLQPQSLWFGGRWPNITTHTQAHTRTHMSTHLHTHRHSEANPGSRHGLVDILYSPGPWRPSLASDPVAEPGRRPQVCRASAGALTRQLGAGAGFPGPSEPPGGLRARLLAALAPTPTPPEFPIHQSKVGPESLHFHVLPGPGCAAGLGTTLSSTVLGESPFLLHTGSGGGGGILSLETQPRASLGSSAVCLLRF